MKFIRLYVDRLVLALLKWINAQIPEAKPPQLPPPATIDVDAHQAELMEVAEQVAIAIAQPIPQHQPVIVGVERLSLVDAWAPLPEPQPEPQPAPEGWTSIDTTNDQDQARPTPEQLEPVISRKQLVEGLLDEAWANGLRTYAQLMKYVELQTGKSCSKRVVSGWKKERGLVDVAA